MKATPNNIMEDTPSNFVLIFTTLFWFLHWAGCGKARPLDSHTSLFAFYWTSSNCAKTNGTSSENALLGPEPNFSSKESRYWISSARPVVPKYNPWIPSFLSFSLYPLLLDIKWLCQCTTIPAMKMHYKGPDPNFFGLKVSHGSRGQPRSLGTRR